MNLIPRGFFFNNDFDDFFITREVNDLKCDIYEKDNKYHIEMDIAGFNKEDISIEIKDKYLTVTVSKEEEKNEEEKNYIKRERSFGKFSRTFTLGNVREEEIEAEFENGTLLITVPKIDEEELIKKIEIK